MKTLKVTVPFEVDVERVKDMLCCAIEGGSNYWVDSLNRMGGITREQAEYRQDVPFVEGGWLELVEKNEDGEGRKFEIRLPDIIRGLKVMAQKYPRAWKDFMYENDDAETGDIFLQCICFGEVIYG